MTPPRSGPGAGVQHPTHFRLRRQCHWATPLADTRPSRAVEVAGVAAVAVAVADALVPAVAVAHGYCCGSRCGASRSARSACCCLGATSGRPARPRTWRWSRGSCPPHSRTSSPSGCAGGGCKLTRPDPASRSPRPPCRGCYFRFDQTANSVSSRTGS